MSNDMRKLMETVLTIEDDGVTTNHMTFQELCANKKRFGIVILGAGGELKDWAEGISGLLYKDGISETEDVFDEYGHVTGNIAGDEGRTDAYFFFNTNNNINTGKLAMWRLSFGDASWVDDFCVNYAKDYGSEVEDEFEESTEVINEYSEDENVVEELEYIQEQMQDLLGQAANIVSGTSEASSAQAYWLAHIETALSNDHGYLGGSMTTMQDTIDALREGDDDEEEDEGDEVTFDPNSRGGVNDDDIDMDRGF